MTSTKVKKISKNQYRFDSKVKKVKNTLAETIYERRIELELSQETLGKIIGIDRKTINRIENGHFSPNLDTLVRIFAALGIKAKSVFEVK
jgi:DNA-binding XRE family transcriptional regulator